MIINAMKLALEALENASPAAWASRVDSDTMKSIWRKHADALKGLQVLLAELDNASCKPAQKRLEAQQPASKEHLFELWWEAHMPNATQEKAWTAFTAAVASNGVGIAAQQPATTEPVADGLPLIVAGAIFDFAGFLTTRAEVIEVGSTANAGPVADLVKEWAELRGLNLADAAVLSWQLHITRASLPVAQQPATTEPVKGLLSDMQAIADGAIKIPAREFAMHALAEFGSHPAQSAPADVVRDAERWRHAISDGGNQSMSFIDIFNGWDGDGDFVEVFDAAMLAAKEGGAA